ncbi:hypothetical protein [Kitasatospora sp. NPDC001175]|uniref:hypothetical protein n=1 Tax=Kitasatospora sp. NPDC001175 TaxID=3157103 RepID=UPI003D07E242
MTAINAIARHRRPEDMPDWGSHVQERVGWPVAERSAELVGLALAGRLNPTVPVDESDALALLVLSQSYGHECAVTLAVEHWLALHIDADPDLRGGFLFGAEYTLDRVDRQNHSLYAQQRARLVWREPARSPALAATAVMVCGCRVRFEAVASTGEPYTHSRRWMRDDPLFNEGAGEEALEQGPETCADCLAFSADPVIYVDCPSCTGWRDAATG